VLAAEETADLAEVDEAFTVRQALGGLSDACQDILDRFFARDQSYKTISDELEIPSGTIASRIARCLGRLKAELEGRNRTEEGSRE
jgi:DNA-directed RNA polymerase specialized sigma24 family protein